MSQNVTNSEKDLSEKQVLAIPHLVSAKSVGETAEGLDSNNRRDRARGAGARPRRETFA